MITPKLTAVMVAVTALIGAGPVAAFAQATNEQTIGDQTNAAVIETGGNTQTTASETIQEADNSIEISQEVETGDAEAEAEGGDAEAEAEAEAESESESGDSKGKYSGGSESESEADAEAEAEAEGGDAEAEAESGDATGVQIVEGNTFDNDVTQTATTTQVPVIEDSDVVTTVQDNVAVQLQETPVALDLEVLLEGLVL